MRVSLFGLDVVALLENPKMVGEFYAMIIYTLFVQPLLAYFSIITLDINFWSEIKNIKLRALIAVFYAFIYIFITLGTLILMFSLI